MARPDEWGGRGCPEPLIGLARVLSAGPKKVCQDLRDTGLSAIISLSGDLEGSGGFKEEERASLVAQWLRICLLMQGTRVRALVWEDPTCRGEVGPVSRNY